VMGAPADEGAGAPSHNGGGAGMRRGVRRCLQRGEGMSLATPYFGTTEQGL
jgi:hypothetical protein